MSKRPAMIPLGFEVGTGDAVSIPLGHLVVFGQTQEAGKTTALEALIRRFGGRAIAFATKRGEGGFAGAREIKAYLEERTDWQSVQAILESAMQAKQDFKQAWIMRVCEGASTLSQVQENTRRLMDSSKKGMDQDMYYVLAHYFDIVIPQIRDLPRSNTVELSDGLNVMNLIGFRPELQALVIRSTIEWVHREEDGVVTVIPEAWRFLPQGRRSPVKLAAEQLVREGAGLHNFMWVDSQDIAGVEKLPLRAAKVWLIGVQRETNEVRRNLANVPAHIAKPKASDIAGLQLGQFYACFGSHAIKTYVQPIWMTEDEARDVAMGHREPFGAGNRKGNIFPQKAIAPAKIPPQASTRAADSSPASTRSISPQTKEKPVAKTQAAADYPATLADSLARLNARLDTMGAAAAPPAPVSPAAGSAAATPDEESLYQRFKARLLADAPQIVVALTKNPEIRIEFERETVKVDGKTTKGRVVRLLADRWFKEGKRHVDVYQELKRTGAEPNNKTLSGALTELHHAGFLTLQGKVFAEVAGMITNIKK